MKSTTSAIALSLLAILAGCTAIEDAPPSTAIAAQPAANDQSMHEDVAAILAKHDLPSAAVGLVRANRLAMEWYYGTEKPAIPATRETRFEIASVTKTITAETVLRLVDQGLLDLDEPLASYWVDPDVAEDPNLQSLTARHVLTHRTGFPNWRFFRDDRKLAFEAAPGEAYGYSGEGMNYLGRAIEEKLGRPFPQIVDEQLFEPLRIEDAVIGNTELNDRFAMLRDKDGTLYHKHCRPGFCFPEGDWSAAGGLAISLSDYAKILAAIGSASGYDPTVEAERNAVVSNEEGAQLVLCDQVELVWCPTEQGYGLGFQVTHYPDRTVIGHSGGDWSTLSVAYIDPQTGDGAIIFLNAGGDTSAPAMVELLRRIDPDSPYIPKFAARSERSE